VTVRQLLEHAAGLGDMWSTPRRPVPGLTGALGYAAAVAHAPLLFEPGTRWSYSNEGYAVLAAIVERHGGLPFRDYLRRHVLAPAGMTATSLDAGADDLVPDRAVGYRPRDDDPLGAGVPRANWTFVGTGGSGGAGGGYSTVGDLARFGRALREGKLLSAAARDAMWTGRWDVAGYPGERYGLGSFVATVGGRLVVGHGGGGSGSGLDNGFRHFVDGSYTIVVLSNVEPPAATELTRRLVRLFGERAPSKTATASGSR
jgi:CubicO group peptidase (beta-lactamase class C family)